MNLKEISETVNNVLIKEVVKVEEFDSRKVFFLNKEGFEILWNIRNEEIENLKAEGLNENMAKREALKNFFKIINPYKKGIKVVNYGYLPVYKLVSDKNKILKRYLEEEFISWQNKYLREAKKYIKTLNDVNEQEKYMQKVKNDIEIARIEKDKILNNPEKYNLIYTDYLYIDQDKLLKPYIYYYYNDNNGNFKKNHSYLKKEVPNIVYEDKVVKPQRINPRAIEKRLSQMQNLFGKIFIKENNSAEK